MIRWLSVSAKGTSAVRFLRLDFQSFIPNADRLLSAHNCQSAMCLISVVKAAFADVQERTVPIRVPA